MIIDVAVTGVDGCSRCVDENRLQPLIIRFGQKIINIASRLTITVFSFICSQREHKLRLVDGQVEVAKKKLISKLWTRHISAAINSTASRNIQQMIMKMFNVSISAQRQATSCHVIICF